MTPEQRHALLIVSSILQGLIQREDEIVKVNIDPPWRGTIGEALDLADRALEPGEPSDPWKHGAEFMRHAILQQIPGGQICDPQQIADMIRAIAAP